MHGALFAEKDTLKIRVGGCTVALFVNINPNGGFYTDHDWWSEIARRGKFVADTCLMGHNIGGGAGVAGKGKESPHHPSGE